jgi:arabinose-5-phosphate isomerase
VPESASLSQALLEITQKGMGMTAIVDQDNHPIGVFTDGDLRRLIERVQDFTVIQIRDVMHLNPRRVRAEQLAVDAVAIMEEHRINQMLVVDADDKLTGALHIHDLTRAKVI